LPLALLEPEEDDNPLEGGVEAEEEESNEAEGLILEVNKTSLFFW
jgi:hypothetical protein